MKTLVFDLVSIGEAARHYGVSVETMSRWDRNSKLNSHSRTLGNHRRYKLNESEKIKVGYARVSSYDQKKDLVTQAKYLSQYCDVVLEDLGSGLNFEQELCKDVITLMTVFSARMYGKRSHQNKKFKKAA